MKGREGGKLERREVEGMREESKDGREEHKHGGTRSVEEYRERERDGQTLGHCSSPCSLHLHKLCHSLFLFHTIYKLKLHT